MNILPTNHHRHGFMLIEFLIAMGFVALVTGLTLKMHHERVDFDRVSTQRLTDQLAIENMAKRLALEPYADIPDAAVSLSNESEIEIDVTPFDSESASGVHVVIELESGNGPLRHHVWRLEPKS